ncbi:MAG: hypothetical protein HXX08_01960 [Chloroflexi bacterium]|uniref:Glycosyltransferase RgtA/B/C/D-like domain-containing protein n=1 Tax=Candidatus Chlorohelix allophototropha TaxID=3003348 RepID=A0A8T7LZ23_9CHLR|nr:hypothetical protein [Chloroflexota bacterium]WJW66509.1 hypothetical protein OZ401_002312 [Chloroflexota bacterium L227-S17]
MARSFAIKTKNFLLHPDALSFYFFLFVSFFIMYPLSAYMAVSTVTEGDSLLQMWSMRWTIHSLTIDPANLFNANLFYPYTNSLAFADAMIAPALQAMPIFFLSGNIVLSYNVLTWFSFALSGWAMYLLVKDISGSRLGGLVAGMVFAFAPYRIGRISQLNVLSTQWLPLCFLLLRRLVLQDSGSFKLAIKRDWWLVAGFVFFYTLTAYSTFYYLLYTAPVFAVFVMLLQLSTKRLPSPALLLKLVLGLGLVGLLVLPVAFPYFEVTSLQSAERTRSEAQQFSANYRFYLATTDNNLFWGNTLSRFGGTGGERKLFPGALGLVFGTIGLVCPLVYGFLRRRKKEFSVVDEPTPIKQLRREGWVWFGVALFALLMSFGPALKAWGAEIPMPYGFFFDYVPGWKGLRAVMRYGLFVTLVVAVLAGMGVAFLAAGVTLWQRFSRNVRRFSPFGLMAILLFGAFWEYHSEITYINPKILPNPPRVYSWLAQPENSGAVIELPFPRDPRNSPAIRNFYSLSNFQPLVGGMSGYVPPVYGDMRDITDNFPSKESLALLQGMGIRWVVYHLNDENTPLPSGAWDKIESRIKSTKELMQAADFSTDKIKVYELAADPWMLNLARSIPTGSNVITSDYRRTQPATIEFTQTIFQRFGHKLYGNDRVGYRFPSSPPTGTAVDYGLFGADEDPSPYGFSATDEVWSGNGLKFYKRKEPSLVAYDVGRAASLRDYATLKGQLELEIGKNEVKFNGNSVGKGKTASGASSYLNLTLATFYPQKAIIRQGNREITLNLATGLTNWRSSNLNAGEKISLEPSPGQSLQLSRVELLDATSQNTEALSPASGNPAILNTTSRQDGDKFISNFEILTPSLSAETPGKYTLTLDVYRRPWGTHPSGHFGNWSIALPGSQTARKVEFTFDPKRQETSVTVDGNRVDMGAEVIRPGDGDWAVFIALWRNDPQNPTLNTQVGVARLYEFSLEGQRLSDITMLPDRPLFFLPPLK